MSDTKAAGAARVGVQKFGRFLSGMVLPNIGAFIAWGLITALFIPVGWIPNEALAKMVGPMISYLLPLLIAYTGGKLVHDTRGGVIATITAMGVIVGDSAPMFLGAMIVGPAAAWCMKQFDRMVEGKIPTGFEMLVNNFSLGILGMLLAIVGFFVVGPVMGAISAFLAAGVKAIVSWNALPLANLFIEPGKILFLNNAINHGVLSPIGIQDAAANGKSIMFMLESNPGPGLGVLLAYWLAGKGMAKDSAPSAIIIHFFGGIHEIYFPYVLMSPKLLLAVIAGGMAGTLTFGLLGAGLVAPPSPGSIFAYIAMTPKGGHLAIFTGILVATAVSFVVAYLLLRFTKQAEGDLAAAAVKTAGFKGAALNAAVQANVTGSRVKKIVFACDAGMGSSAMGASLLRGKVQKAGLSVTVTNTAINELPSDADLVITHSSLTPRAKEKLPQAEHLSVDDFLKSPVYDQLVERLGK
jgi:mannitol PTS system EIICBA or EIICB component